MDTPLRCPNCSKPLAPGAPHGLCPTCLLNAGLSTAAGTQSPGSRAGGFVPPTPAALAPLFPQLEIIALIGQGGMGAVYRARQPSLDREVALKILPPQVGRYPGFAERFTREARALARLSHPNIVGVHDFGQAGGFHYLIMEFVDGVTLRHLLAIAKTTPREALAIVPQICDALQFAHDKGIVHRDIKPENILVAKSGAVKIADFGLAKLMGAGTPDYTITGERDVMGTPHYMAPEQVEHPLEVDHRADIYSLGVVFYQMLTGELPLGRFAPPSRKVQIDVRLDEVVLRALEKEPEHRYQQASGLRTELETIATTRPPDTTAPVRRFGLREALLVAAALLVMLTALVLLQRTLPSRVPTPGGIVSKPADAAVRAPVVSVLPADSAPAVTSPNEGRTGTTPLPKTAIAARLQAAYEELEDLQGKFTNTHPRVQNVRRLIADLRKLEARENELQVAQISLLELQQKYGSRHPLVLGQQRKIDAIMGRPEIESVNSSPEPSRPASTETPRVSAARPATGEDRPVGANTPLRSPHLALTRGIADFDTMESNPEILRIQLRAAELEQADIERKMGLGVATNADVQHAAERVSLFKAKLADDRVRFAEIRVAAAEQRLENAKARYDAGLIAGAAVEAAREDVAIEKARLKEAQSKATEPAPPRD